MIRSAAGPRLPGDPAACPPVADTIRLGEYDWLPFALEAGGIGTLDVDLDGLVARRGGPGARAIGLGGEEPLAHDEFLRLLYPDDRAAVSAAFEATLQTGARYDVTYRIQSRTDGTLRWLSVRAEPLTDEAGRPRRLVGIVQDVTAQKLAETALRESEARLRLAQHAGRLGSFDWPVDSPGMAISEEYAALFGLPRGTLQDSQESWLQRVHEADRPRVEAELVAMLKSGTLDTEYRIVRADDGATRWLASRAEMFAQEGDAAARVIGTVCDVTDRRVADAELRRWNEELERRVAAEVEARQQAQLQLAQSQRMEAIGQLTGGIAHDFNNMLQGVTSGIELARRRIAAGRAGEAADLLDAAREAAGRAASLTRRLLAFGRRQPLDPKPVALDDLLRGMAELVRRTVGAEIAVALNLLDGCWPVFCDPAQLESALLNLAINARDAMLPGGGRLCIETAHVTLGPNDVRDWGDATLGDYVRITVADTGVGMPADILPHVFEPFFTTKPDGLGTGLGLSQVYGFVRQSSGVLRLESAPGEGTAVHLFLARAPALDAARPEPPRGLRAPSSAVGGSATILLVEDEANVRSFAADMLRSLRYRVLEAGDGPAGLETLRATLRAGDRVDLLVSDIGLPGGLNGRQLADAARELAPSLPVLLTTGYAGYAIEGEGRLDRGMQLLAKPFELDALAERIEGMVRAAASPG